MAKISGDRQFLLITISRNLPSNGKRSANNRHSVKRSFPVMRTTKKQKNKPPQNGEKALFYGGFAGAPERTRISGLLLRRQTLYPTELRAHVFFIQFLVARMTRLELAAFGFGNSGTGSDLLLRRQTLYPTELRARMSSRMSKRRISQSNRGYNRVLQLHKGRSW